MADATAPRYRHWLARLAGECRRHPAACALAGLAAVLVIGLEGVGPLIVRQVVDDAVGGRTGRLLLFGAVLAALACLRFAGSFASKYAADRLGLDVQHDLRRQVFASIQRLDGGRHDRLRTGEVMSRTTTDLQMLQGLVTALPMMLGTAVLAAVAFAAMASLSIPMTAVALAVIGATGWVTVRSAAALFSASWAAQQQAAVLAQQVTETVEGVRVVKGLGQEEAEVGRFERAARRLYAVRVRTARLTARPSGLLVAVPALGQAVMLGLGGLLAMQGRLSLGTFVAFSAYVTLLLGPVRLVATLFLISRSSRSAVERVYELIDLRPEVTEAPGAVDLPPGPLGLRLDDARFGYEDSPPVLDGFSIEVRPGETLALVGPAGCGKSTVSALLSRFYDVQAGSVRVGPPGAETDVRDLKLRSLRSAVGVVMEDPVLFSGTIRDNIAYGRPDATPEEVEAAARAAEVHDTVRALPDGYDTVVGERGLTLSGGQRQRIALARGLLTAPRVLVLDDATSAVDTATEAAIHATLKKVTRDRTTVLVAHRRSSLALADRIAVMDRGRIVDVGTWAELEARCALFSALLAGPGERLEGPGERLEGGDGQIVPGPSAEDRDLWPVTDSAAAAAVAANGAGARPPMSVRAPDVTRLPPATEEPRVPGAVDVRAPEPPFPLSRLLRPVRGGLLAAVVLMGLDASGALAVPALVRMGIDAGVRQEAASALALATGLAVAVALARGLASAAQTVVIARAGESLLYLVRVRSFAQLQRLGLDYYERHRSGAITTRMTSDVEALTSFVQTGLANAVVGALTCVGIAVALLATDAALAAVAAAVLPAVAVATWVFRRFSADAYAESRERIGAVNADLQESLSGLRTSQAHNGEGRSAARFDGHSDAYRRAGLRARRYIATYLPFVALTSDVAQLAVLAAGAHRVAAGDLRPGVLMAALLYLSLLLNPIQQMSNVLDGLQRAKAGLSRIDELLRVPYSVPTPGGGHAIPVPARLRGGITLDAVSYRYPGADRSALRDVTLHLAPGETVAVVGASGAGKSTLLKLVARLYEPTGGRVLADGVDVRRFDPSAYRRRLGLVPQEPHLFAGDVAGNIGYPRPDAPPEAIEAAARRVGALDMIRELPNGFRQRVDERGRGLSAGQRQLVALARAELADPDVLLLDEATAALDQRGEAAVFAALDRLSARRTTLVIAHRLSTAARADRVAVLHDGELVECGRHGDLLAAGGRYARLWSAGRPDAA
ncbi:ABC transporter ATP-binding protein [Actinomadura sp. 9N215]|uniref:ABC transporter ATP-binding protein n=1 Tax=Actinomadura sp. 9N215 TaxID=3375150 RepID=UPI0037A7B15E